MKAPVVFDLDGVLADFYAGYEQVAHQLGKVLPVSTSWDDYWDEDVWKAIRTSRDFWFHLHPLVDQPVFHRIDCLQDVRDVYFVTAREGVKPQAQTIGWLEKYGLRKPTVVVTGKKGEFARAVKAGYLLDDKAGNAVYTAYHSPRTVACLLDRPYNQFSYGVLGRRVVRLQTVEEFLDKVERG